MVKQSPSHHISSADVQPSGSALVNLAEAPGQPSLRVPGLRNRGWYRAPPPLPKPAVSSEGIVCDHLPQKSNRQILLHPGLEVEQPVRKLCFFLVPGDGAQGQGTQATGLGPNTSFALPDFTPIASAHQGWKRWPNQGDNLLRVHICGNDALPSQGLPASFLPKYIFSAPSLTALPGPEVSLTQGWGPRGVAMVKL